MKTNGREKRNALITVRGAKRRWFAVVLAVLLAAALTAAGCVKQGVVGDPTAKPAATAQDQPAKTEPAAATDDVSATQDAAPTDAVTAQPTEIPPEPTDVPPGPTDVPPEPSGRAGYYKLSGGTIDGETVTPEYLSNMEAEGEYFFLVLEEGGTAFINMFGDEAELTWNDTQLTEPVFSGNSMDYIYDNGTIRLEAGGEVVEFTRSDEPAPVRGQYGTALLPPETNPTVSNERAGYYVLAGGTMNGEEVTPELLATLSALGMKCFIVLEEGGTGFLNMFGSEFEITWTDTRITEADSGEPVAYTYDNGRIRLEQDGYLDFARSSEPAPERGEYASGGFPETGESPEFTRLDEISFDGLTVVDNDQITIRATRIEVDELDRYLVYFDLANKTADKTLVFGTQSLTVNGLQVDGYINETLTPGTTAEGSLYVNTDDLLLNGGTDPTVITVDLQVTDDDNFLADPLFRGTATIYPLGEDKVELFSYTAAESDQVLADNDDFTLILRSVEDKASSFFPSVQLEYYIVNKSDKTLVFTFDSITVGSAELSTYFYEKIGPGTSAFAIDSWDKEPLDNAGVTEYNKFTLVLKVRDAANMYGSEPVFNASIEVG